MKKKFIFILSVLLSLNYVFAAGNKDEDEKPAVSHGGLSEVPAAKRPKKADPEKVKAAEEKDENDESYENNRKTILYGLPSEIAKLLEELTSNEDPRYVDDLYDLFQISENASIKEKILKYFTILEDPCLEDYAVNLINDPYDEKADVVNAALKYIQTVKTVEAVPAVLTLIESENENYFTQSLATLGEIGSAEEAGYIAEYLERSDFSVAQRQNLMRTLGKMQAVETFDRIVEILEDEDENTFVRMYAAEAIGLMQKKESVDILIRNYSAGDPNFRQYIVKGLENFPNDKKACSTIIQAIRDEHWKVRQEAIKACEKMKLEDSVQFLIYRAKNDSEKVIKDNSYEVIAALNTKEGNDFLIGQLTEKKVGDSTKAKIVQVLLKEGHTGEKEILELADECLKDDKRKNLRYAIGKELAKHSKQNYEVICGKYLDSSDANTINIGLDMYKNHKFKCLEPKMVAIAKDKKANASTKTRIKKMLNLSDEELEKASDKEEPHSHEEEQEESES